MILHNNKIGVAIECNKYTEATFLTCASQKPYCPRSCGILTSGNLLLELLPHEITAFISGIKSDKDLNEYEAQAATRILTAYLTGNNSRRIYSGEF